MIRFTLLASFPVSVLPGSCLPAVLLKKWIGLDEGTIVKTTTESVSKTTGEISSLDRYYISSLNFLNAHIAERSGGRFQFPSDV